jgi:hypothetical protein
MGHLLFSFRSVVVVATRRAAALSNALRYEHQYDALRYDCQAVISFFWKKRVLIGDTMQRQRLVRQAGPVAGVSGRPFLDVF